MSRGYNYIGHGRIFGISKRLLYWGLAVAWIKTRYLKDKGRSKKDIGDLQDLTSQKTGSLMDKDDQKEKEEANVVISGDLQGVTSQKAGSLMDKDDQKEEKEEVQVANTGDLRGVTSQKAGKLTDKDDQKDKELKNIKDMTSQKADRLMPNRCSDTKRNNWPNNVEGMIGASEEAASSLKEEDKDYFSKNVDNLGHNEVR